MPHQILETQGTHVISLPAAIVVFLLGLVINRVLDHYTDQNVRILKELTTIRKDMSSSSPDAMKVDEIIHYRRKRYLRNQIEAFEKMKDQDRKETLKVASHTSAFAKWIDRQYQKRAVLAIGSLVCLIVVLIVLNLLHIIV